MGSILFARRARTAVASTLVAALLVAGFSGVGASAAIAADSTTPSGSLLLQRDENVVTSDPIPTVQIDDGYVWAQTTIGTTVYAVGKFDNAREPLALPGAAKTARSNALAYDIETGDLLPFAPVVNGVIKAVAASPDGSRIYIGGSFNSVNGQARWNFAALDATTGELIPAFYPAVGGSGVYSLQTDGSKIYLGGLFTQVNGVSRSNLAALDDQHGAVLDWSPKTDLQVDAMVMDPAGSNVVIGGRFSQVNGDASVGGSASIDKGTGALDTNWALSKTIQNGDPSGKTGVYGLAADETGVYGTAWAYLVPTQVELEGTFAAEAGTGEVRWIADCLGDNYGVYSTGKVVYSTSHMHGCETMDLQPDKKPATYRHSQAYTTEAQGTLGEQTNTRFKNWAGSPAPAAYAWGPTWGTGTATGMNQAGLSITGAGDMISIGGEFLSVNGGQFAGLVRFSTSPPDGPTDGPRLAGTNWVPTATSTVPGRVKISIPSNWDRDDLALTYELRRAGTAAPIASKTVDSTWWDSQTITLQDDGGDPGAEQTYTVVARDGDGNGVESQSVRVTVAAGESITSAYSDAVEADGPQLYYPLGTATQDLAGSNLPTSGSGVKAATDGVGNSATNASNFDGTSNGRVSSSSKLAVAEEFSTEIWFKTDTTTGGKLIGYGSLASGNSSSFDRQLYMSNAGTIVFGTFNNGATSVIQSEEALNDNTWHHAVGSLSAEGMKLFIDGELVASDPDVTQAKKYLAYWRIGGDNFGGWPLKPSSSYFKGALDEVAVYPYALSADQVQNHFKIGDGLQAPTAALTVQMSEMTVQVDGLASTSGDAEPLTAYAWDFGDGATASGAEASHEYAAAGTYTVRLTVTDGNQLSSSAEKQVVVQQPDTRPVVASDGFDRAVDAGWGAADSGGSWTPLQGRSSALSVADGAGVISLTAGQTREMLLDDASVRDSETEVSYSFSEGPSSGSVYVGAGARRTDTAGYRALAWHRSDGAVWLVIQRDGVAIASKSITGLTWDSTSVFHLSTATSGSGSTTIQAKIWLDGQTEPQNWQVSTTDSTPALQGEGSPSVFSYRAGSATGTNVISVDSVTTRGLAG
ncbi:LamG-like jellyroll fold domain-containing protein [Microbacterium sp. NPDC076768]|uniref:LamG-like jellyroll fold domain-containing protein n=1 Tax=Microbacterium sp. NPDC076768 TaxID=3154858 RepID=UPI00344983E4